MGCSCQALCLRSVSTKSISPACIHPVTHGQQLMTKTSLGDAVVLCTWGGGEEARWALVQDDDFQRLNRFKERSSGPSPSLQCPDQYSTHREDVPGSSPG